MFPSTNARCNSEDSLISWSNRNAVAQRSKSVPRMYGCVETTAASTSAASQINNPHNNFGPHNHNHNCRHSIACAVAGAAGRRENDAALSALNVQQHLRQTSDSNAGGNNNNHNHGGHIAYRQHTHQQHHVGSPNRYSYSGGGVAGGVGSSSGALLHLSTNRLDPFSAPTTTVGSSLLGDSMTEIVVDDLRHAHEPTSELLDYCKRKFLRPFIIVLSLVGVNPIPTDTSKVLCCLNYTQALVVLLILLFGYFLQYLCSYRGDRGFIAHDQDLTNDPNSNATYTVGQLLFGHIFPNLLNLSSFISAVIVFKILDQEQLQNLIERVFLTTLEPRHLCKLLWSYLLSGVVLLAFLFAYTIPSVLLQSRIIQVKWFTGILADWELATKIVLIITLFVQDLVEVIILANYCIQCYLLRVHISSLSHKLLMHSIETTDWMREVLEFHKLLEHLNRHAAVPVCFLTVMNLAYAFAGLIYIFNDLDFHYSALEIVILNIFNVLLWLLLGVIPFVLAASVTHACQKAQANGHHIRARPFVYHSTSTDDLNSTLLFSSSLQMSAKIFKMPIQPNYLCCALLSISILVLTLGMCLNPSIISIF
uniref:Protein CrcB homolog n=1 Tax=Zeugodacus cucurbitae TaxID=28588 RepID=A0A0A1WUY8_ZEUCU